MAHASENIPGTGPDPDVAVNAVLVGAGVLWTVALGALVASFAGLELVGAITDRFVAVPAMAETRSGALAYAYEWEGIRYTSFRVDPIFDSAADRDWASDRAEDASGRLTAWVAPWRPSFAVLRRADADDGPGLMLLPMLALFLLGPALLAKTGRGLADALRARVRRRLHPNEPWRWNPRWDGGLLAPDDEAIGPAVAFATPVLALLVAPFAIDLFVAPWSWWELAVIPFVGVVVLAARWSWRERRRARPLGAMRLRLAQVPLVPGGPLDAVLDFGRAPADVPRIVIAAWQRVEQNPLREGRRQHFQRLFERPFEAASVATGDAGARFRISGALPEHVRASDDEGLTRVTWTLTVRARAADGKVEASFELPVFRPATGAAAMRSAPDAG